ncbi:MAG: flagellar hook protein FlgE [Pyrinomonadaceae bacterium]
MGFSFSAALSGLRANSNALGVTGNNIANANTVAYKSGSISFADIFSSSSGVRLNGSGSSVQTGNGVRTSGTSTNFSQGGINESGTSTHAAIEGNGFFVARDKDGALAYTRAGDFNIDRDGYLTTPNGFRVQGYTAVNGQIPAGSIPDSLRIPLGDTIAPVTTSEATLRMNLNSSDPAGDVFHAPVQVYDSRGVARTLDLVMTKQADGSYLLNATLDGVAANASIDGGAASNAPVAVTFDANGRLATPNTLSIVPDQTQLGGATLPSIALNLRQPGTNAPNLTNYASPSTVSSTAQDGFASGTLTGLVFGDRSGTLSAVFSNGQRYQLGQLALATFNAPSGLSHVGNNLYVETPGSGQPSVGQPDSGGRGGVLGGALEQSNVDIASEFTDLIVAQRGFQANSRVITTINQTLQDLLQIV